MSATVHPLPHGSTRWDVVGIGASCIDDIYRLPVFPQAGSSLSKIPVGSHTVGCGGQTATTLATCSRLGLRAKYAGVVGHDDRGRLVRAELDRRGVDTSDLAVREGETPSAVILVDDTGDRLVLWHRDDQLSLPPDSLPLVAISAARLVHVDDVDEPAAIAAAGLAHDAGVPVTCDIDRVTRRTTELLELVTVPILAAHVPLQLTGEPDHERALRALRQRHPGLFCVTLGTEGAMALDGDTLLRAPAFSVDVVDTTGAGDVFRGGLIYALLRSVATGDALLFANAAAAVSCTRLGAMAGAPSLEEVNRVLATGRPRV